MPERCAAIRRQAQELGFDAVGITGAHLPQRVRDHLGQFLAEGRHGAMGWLADKAERRGSPQGLWPEARSVILVGLSYAPAEDPRAGLAWPERGLISVYARGRDYHDLIKGRLKTLALGLVKRWGGAVKVFVDTAPVMEKPLAAQAGLGWQGKHTNLVSRTAGSWLFLGALYTTLELPPDPPAADHCGCCRRCLDACPSGALPEPYRIEPRRCLAYLTIEHPGPIEPALRPLMGNRIYGCDDCLAVCPWNRFARRSREAAFLPRAELTAPRLADLAQLDDAGFRQVLAGSPIKRIGRERFLRNVAIALGNSAADSARAPLERLAAEPSPVIGEAARWGLAQLAAARAQSIDLSPSGEPRP